MVDLDALASRLDEEVILEFEDGHTVRAKLITVDKDEPEEIIYSVLEVVQVGPSTFKDILPGTKAAANPRELRRASFLAS